jgi:hypothetical protein
MHTNPLSEFKELVLGMLKNSAIINDTIQRSFFTKSVTQCLPQFQLILDGHLSRHLQPAPFCL